MKPKTNSGAGKIKTNSAKRSQNAVRRGRPPKPPIVETSEKDYRASKVSPTFFGVRLTSGDKILYPDDGITKLELARYFVKVAAWILPHVGDRPLSLVRCPEGSKKECFFQKHPGIGTPDNLGQIPIREKDKVRNYLLVNDPSQLISLAQIAALEIHVWGSRVDELEKPDRMIFDLDPDPSLKWDRVVESAHDIRALLRELGLESFVKTTGGKGLHIVVPLQRRNDWDEVKSFSEAVANKLVSMDRNRYTANMSKAVRPGKIFVDYLRNGRGATAIAAYSPRARAGAPVSVPLTWEELTPDIRPNQFTIRNLEERLKALDRDPWSELNSTRQSLTAQVRRKLRTIGINRSGE